jgi:hypothetical protein
VIFSEISATILIGSAQQLNIPVSFFPSPSDSGRGRPGSPPFRPRTAAGSELLYLFDLTFRPTPISPPGRLGRVANVLTNRRFPTYSKDNANGSSCKASPGVFRGWTASCLQVVQERA